MTVKIHPSWHVALHEEFEKPYWEELTSFIKEEYRTKRCFPEGKNIFRAYDLTPFEQVKVVILGQDPYHTAYESFPSSKMKGRFQDSLETRFPYTQEGQEQRETGLLRSSQGQKQKELPSPICAAMGLSFSTPEGSKPQPSLRNIFKELASDLGTTRTKTDLTDWAEQGVLLLNAVLTVRQGEANSHQGKGWEHFTDATIRTLSQEGDHIVFILWGAYAIAKKSLIDANKHLIITSPHPSPFSADRGFFGSKPFSKTNEYLEKIGKKTILWA